MGLGKGIDQRYIDTLELRPMLPWADGGIEIEIVQASTSEAVTEMVETMPPLDVEELSVTYQATVPKKTIEPVEVLPSFKTELPDWAIMVIATAVVLMIFSVVALIIMGSPLAPLSAWSIVVGVITAMWCAVRGIINRQAVYDGNASE